jgi:hypothetical protein
MEEEIIIYNRVLEYKSQMFEPDEKLKPQTDWALLVKRRLECDSKVFENHGQGLFHFTQDTAQQKMRLQGEDQKT